MAETTLVLDLYDRAERLQRSMPFSDAELAILRQVKWDMNFLIEFCHIAYADAFVRMLNQSIPGLNAYEALPDFIDDGIANLIDHLSGAMDDMTPQQRDEYKKRALPIKQLALTWFYETADSLQKEIHKLVGTNRTFDLWTCKIDSENPNHALCQNEGDFRVLEWQMRHLDEDGVYHQDSAEDNEDRLIYHSVPEFLTAKSLKGATFYIMGFDQFYKEEGYVGEVMPNLPAHTTAAISDLVTKLGGKATVELGTNAEYAIRPDDSCMTPELWVRANEVVRFVPNIKWVTESQFVHYLEN